MKNGVVGNEVMVGIDPRQQSLPALAWAVEEAAYRGACLRLVVAVPPLPGGQHVDAPWRRTMLRVEGETALAEAAATARSLHSEVPVMTELVDGMPPVVLCQRARQARMVVVGSRRLSRPEELVRWDSVAVPVSARTDCPAVVVREAEHAWERDPHLVVGVDGSESSRIAVGFAADEAALHGVALRALWVWRRPVVSLGDEAVGLEERRGILSETVSGWANKYPDVEISCEVIRGNPVEQLALASLGAFAVVVGRHGSGGYSGMRIGSVVHGLLHRAECPVITVPGSLRG